VCKHKQECRKKFKWIKITLLELKKFLGLLLYMAVVNMPKRVDFWRKDTVFSLPFPATVFARDRFLAISSNLHISDPADDEENDKTRGTADYDALQKVKPLLDHIRNRSMAIYHPKRNISVDERMVATKARLSIKQYMKAKPTSGGSNSLFWQMSMVTQLTTGCIPVNPHLNQGRGSHMIWWCRLSTETTWAPATMSSVTISIQVPSSSATWASRDLGLVARTGRTELELVFQTPMKMLSIKGHQEAPSDGLGTVTFYLSSGWTPGKSPFAATSTLCSLGTQCCAGSRRVMV